jgi:hypothetical protein
MHKPLTGNLLTFIYYVEEREPQRLSKELHHFGEPASDLYSEYSSDAASTLNDFATPALALTLILNINISIVQNKIKTFSKFVKN